MILALLLVLCLMLPAHATNYYIAPAGSDSNDGLSTGAPWLTFGHARPILSPGDTLWLLDGTYTVATNGTVFYACPASTNANGAQNGTAGNPITMKAVNERQAHIEGDGHVVVYFDRCAYWTFDGLYISNIDAVVSGSDGSVMVLDHGDHLVLTRNVAANVNAWFNSHGIALYNTANTLVEENELYLISRHGIVNGNSVDSASGNVVRRNYLHSRAKDAIRADNPICSTGADPDWPGENVCLGAFYCVGSCQNLRGDEGISCYPCQNTYTENNIVENFEGPYTIQGKYQPFNLRYYGNIALSSGTFTGGARSGIANNTADQMPTNGIYVNNVALNSDGWYTFGCRVCKNMQYTNNTSINNITAFVGALFDPSCGAACDEGGDGILSFYMTNHLMIDTNGVAFEVSGQTDWAVAYLRAYNTTGSNPSLADSHFSNVTTSDPGMGTCKVYIPDTSNLKGAGLGGADIGANILYRYQDGVLTSTPLWDQTTGAFPCGAIIAGVNDIAGASCFDVHERLNVNSGGCAFPAGYGGTPPMFLTDVTGLDLAGNTTIAFLGDVTGLDVTAGSTATALGNVTGLDITGNTTPSFLGNVTGLTLE